jgi:hypothetical protein
MADTSLTVRYGATAPRQQWTAQRLLNSEGRRDGSWMVRDGATSSTARNGARQLLDGKGRRERGGNGLRAQW